MSFLFHLLGVVFASAESTFSSLFTISHPSASDAKHPHYVLVTGCSEGGIGSALCLAFQRHGFTVFATARNTLKIPSALTTLPNVHVIALDVTDATSVKNAVDKVEQETQGHGIDVLINNAGAALFGPGLDVDIEQAKTLFDVNFWAALRMTQSFSKQLISNKGAIVNVGSMIGEVRGPYIPIYTASKAALHSLSETLRLELAPFGIRILTLVTGVVESKVHENTSYTTQPNSLYKPVEHYIRDFANGKNYPKPTSAEAFAEQVVSDVLQGRNGKLYRARGSGPMWFCKTFLPTWTLDALLRRGKGLGELERLRRGKVE